MPAHACTSLFPPTSTKRKQKVGAAIVQVGTGRYHGSDMDALRQRRVGVVMSPLARQRPRRQSGLSLRLLQADSMCKNPHETHIPSTGEACGNKTRIPFADLASCLSQTRLLCAEAQSTAKPHRKAQNAVNNDIRRTASLCAKSTKRKKWLSHKLGQNSPHASDNGCCNYHMFWLQLFRLPSQVVPSSSSSSSSTTTTTITTTTTRSIRSNRSRGGVEVEVEVQVQVEVEVAVEVGVAAAAAATKKNIVQASHNSYTGELSLPPIFPFSLPRH